MYGVDDPGHQDGEDDVAVEVASLRDGARDNRGAGCSKCTLNILFKSALVWKYEISFTWKYMKA